MKRNFAIILIVVIVTVFLLLNKSGNKTSTNRANPTSSNYPTNQSDRIAAPPEESRSKKSSDIGGESRPNEQTSDTDNLRKLPPPVSSPIKTESPSISATKPVPPPPAPQNWKEHFEDRFLSMNTIMKSVSVKDLGETTILINGQNMKVHRAEATSTTNQGQTIVHTVYIDSQGNIVQADSTDKTQIAVGDKPLSRPDTKMPSLGPVTPLPAKGGPSL